MKLLLTSTGLTNKKIRDFFVSQFDTFENKKACLIFTVREAGDWQWLEHYDSELKAIGLNYDGINISEEKDLSILPKYDIYYVCGGNTFYILDRLQKTNLDKVIFNEIKNNKFYIGVSAGSIISGPDIEIAGIPGGDENDINLEDLGGFKFISFHISPHFIDQEKNDIEAFQKEKDEPVVAITDDQAIFVTEKESVLIGDHGGLLIDYDLMNIKDVVVEERHEDDLCTQDKDIAMRGSRVVLKKNFLKENYSQLLAWLTDLEVIGYLYFAKRMIGFKTIKDIKNFLAEERDEIFWRIYTNEGKFIGYTSLCGFQERKQCEFSIFILDKNYWGRSIGLEVARLILNYAFNKLGMKTVVLETSEFHRSAIKLYDKAGFRIVEVVPNDRIVFHDGKWVLSGSVVMKIERDNFFDSSF